MLLDRAKEQSKKSFGDLAKELGRNQTRISEWRSGQRKPDAGELAFFAEKAGFRGLEIFEAVAEIESQLRPEYAEVWQRALDWRKR
jgi:transcriptional regulator with XRE-family HTH domain